MLSFSLHGLIMEMVELAQKLLGVATEMSSQYYNLYVTINQHVRLVLEMIYSEIHALEYYKIKF